MSKIKKVVRNSAKRDNIYSIGIKDTAPVVKVRPGRMLSKETKGEKSEKTNETEPAAG